MFINLPSKILNKYLKFWIDIILKNVSDTSQILPTQPQVHHPLDAHYDSVVEEPQFMS
jgi:hypothetical protein